MGVYGRQGSALPSRGGPRYHPSESAQEYQARLAQHFARAEQAQQGQQAQHGHHGVEAAPASSHHHHSGALHAPVDPSTSHQHHHHHAVDPSSQHHPHHQQQFDPSSQHRHGAGSAAAGSSIPQTREHPTSSPPRGSSPAVAEAGSPKPAAAKAKATKSRPAAKKVKQPERTFHVAAGEPSAAPAAGQPSPPPPPPPRRRDGGAQGSAASPPPARPYAQPQQSFASPPTPAPQQQGGAQQYGYQQSQPQQGYGQGYVWQWVGNSWQPMLLQQLGVPAQQGLPPQQSYPPPPPSYLPPPPGFVPGHARPPPPPPPQARHPPPPQAPPQLHYQGQQQQPGYEPLYAQQLPPQPPPPRRQSGRAPPRPAPAPGPSFAPAPGPSYAPSAPAPAADPSSSHPWARRGPQRRRRGQAPAVPAHPTERDMPQHMQDVPAAQRRQVLLALIVDGPNTLDDSTKRDLLWNAPETPQTRKGLAYAWACHRCKELGIPCLQREGGNYINCQGCSDAKRPCGAAMMRRGKITPHYEEWSRLQIRLAQVIGEQVRMPHWEELDGIYIAGFPERRPGIAAQKKLDVKLAREAAVTGSAEATGYPVEGPPFHELKRPQQPDQKWIDYTFDLEEWVTNLAELIPIERDAGWKIMEGVRKKLAASMVDEDAHGWWCVDQSRRAREAEASGHQSFFEGEREERDPYTARGAGRRAGQGESRRGGGLR